MSISAIAQPGVVHDPANARSNLQADAAVWLDGDRYASGESWEDLTPNGNDFLLGSVDGPDSNDPEYDTDGFVFDVDDFASAASEIVSGAGPWSMAARVTITDKAGLDFARADTGTYANSAGVVTAAISGELRDKHWLTDNTDTLRRVTLLERAYNGNLITSDDFDSGWTSFGTPVITSGIDDPAGGTSAYRIADDDGAVREGKKLAVTFTGDAVKAVVFVVREATMASSGTQQLNLFDETAAAWRCQMSITAWVAGEPSVTATTGTLLGKRYIGNGYWAIFAQTTSITAANTHNVYLYVVETATATGSIDVYRVMAFNDAVPPASILAASEVTTADSFTVDLIDATPQEATYLYEGVVLDMPSTGTARWLFNVGNAASSYLGCYLWDGGTRLYIQFHNGTGAVAGYFDVTSMVLGDHVSLRIYQAASGAITAGLTINGGVESSLDGAVSLQALAPSWTLPNVRFSEFFGAAGNVANSGLISFKAQSGAEKSLATMQALTNPDIAYYAVGQEDTRAIMLAQEYGADYPYFGIFLDESERVIYRSKDNSGTAVVTDGGSTMAADSTHNLVITNDGTTVKTYLDGVLQDSVSHSGTYTNVDRIVMGAIKSAVPTFAAQGEKIKQAGVWTRVLTPTEVLRLHNQWAA